jgi:hypothetical protein
MDAGPGRYRSNLENWIKYAQAYEALIQLQSVSCNKGE